MPLRGISARSGSHGIKLQMVQTPGDLSPSLSFLSFTLMSMDIWKVRVSDYHFYPSH